MWVLVGGLKKIVEAVFSKSPTATARALDIPVSLMVVGTLSDRPRSDLKNGVNISGTALKTGVLHGNRERRGDASSEVEKRNGKSGTHYHARCGRRRKD